MKGILFLCLFFFVFSVSAQNQCIDPECKTMSEAAYLSGDRLYCPNVAFKDEQSAKIDLKKSHFSIIIISGFLKNHPDMFCELQIHTDVASDTEANKILSQNRADAIRDLIITEYNIPKYQLQAKGYGDENPVFTQQEINAEGSKEKQEEMRQCNSRTLLKVI